MFDEALTRQQIIVIDALSDGVNSTDAAAQAGVHRNTIANWRRNSLLFRETLADAQYDRALLFRDKTEDRLDLALETLDGILSDPKASASARLKAALFIIDKAITPPQPKKQVPFEIEEVRVSKQTVHTAPAPAPPSNPGENPPKVHNNAQNAQPSIRRETPKVGRNEACPCGSNRKYKHCCLNKPQVNTHVAAA